MFTFEGKIKKGEQDELRDKIKLISGRVLTENLKTNTKNIIQNHYKDKGYLNVKVTLRETPDTILSNSIILTRFINILFTRSRRRECTIRC